jgi:hypothetical protein
LSKWQKLAAHRTGKIVPVALRLSGMAWAWTDTSKSFDLAVQGSAIALDPALNY